MTKSKKFYSYIEGILSVVFNIIIFILKYWVGSLTGSIAFIADAWHSLSDSVSSVIVILGTKVSSKPADKKHPFGHGRSEHIASLIIGMFLVVVAYSFIIEGYKKLQTKEATIYGTSALIVLIISILIKELLAQYAFWAGRRTNSSILKADGWHHRSDALSSIILLLGIFLGKYFWWIDSVLSFIVSIMIAYAAYKILKDTTSNLLGETPPKEAKKAIKRIANSTAGMDVQPHHIHVHNYGDHQELTFHIKFPNHTTLVQAHDITTKIEAALKTEMDMISTIRMEPKNVCHSHN